MSQALNPATGEKLKNYPDYQGPQVDLIIDEVHKAQQLWKQKPLSERARMVGRLGEVLLEKKNKLAEVCTQEMGKLLSESVAEVEKCASACKYYAENAEKFLQDDVIKSDGSESFVTYQPIGLVLAIMPWNFPYWQVIRFAAPALCAGNGAVLKHASNVPGCSLALEEVCKEVGLPFRSLLIPSKEVNRVIENKKIAAVTLTGSTKAGKEVAAKAGECIKKTVLELGGSDAYLILKDADLNLAAKTLVKGRMMNAGQSCISPKRLIIDQAIYDDFFKIVEAQMKDLKYGDPNDSKSSLGSMAREDLREELQKQIDKTISQGGKCILGGKIPEGNGAFYPPTLLVNIKPGMTAFDEELFGPVVCLIPAKNEEEAIQFANLSDYGLGGGIFSQDIQRAKKIATDKLETGGVFINDFLRSDPKLPFGGVKESGYGRELSFAGIKEFVNQKTVYIK